MKTPILKSLVSRLRAVSALISALQMFAAVVLAALGIIAIDAMFILPRSFRELLPLMAGGLLLILPMLAVARLMRIKALRAARWAEARDPGLGTTLTNAVQLSSKTPESSVQEVLCRRAAELGQENAKRLRLLRLPVVRRRIAIWAIAALIAAGFSGAGPLLFDSVFDAVVPRLLDPMGDHPPYSRLSFSVYPGTAEVIYGQNLGVRVETAGRPVEKLFLVTRTGGAENRVPMFLSPDRRFCQTLTGLRDPTRYHVTDGRARTHWYELNIIYTPEIEEITAVITPPEYTGLPERQAMLSGRTLSFPAGSRISFDIRSNRPLASGAISIKPVRGGPAARVPISPGADRNVVSGSFQVDRSVLFSVSITDVDGLTSAEGREGRLDVIADRNPRIYVLEPGRHAVATPESIIPVAVEADDDYAVDGVLWFRGVNGSVERPAPMQTAPVRHADKAVTARSDFNLKDLGVRPGDVIEYFFEAVDSYPAGPHVTTSPIYRLEIISMEAYREIIERQKGAAALFSTYEKLGKWLGRLADRARHLKRQSDMPGAGPPDDAEVRSLREDVAAYRKALAERLRQPGRFDVEALFLQELKAQHDALEILDDELVRASASEPAAMGSQAPLALIHKVLSRLTTREIEMIAEPARQIASVARLMAEAEKFSELIERQAELTRLARRFSEKVALTRINRMELAEIGRKQRNVREALSGLLDGIGRQLEALPNTPEYTNLRNSARKFRYDVEAEGIAGLMARAADNFSELQGALAYDEAVGALEKMKAFASDCGGWGLLGSQALCFNPTLRRHLGDTLGQILSAMGGGGYGTGQNGYSMLSEQVALYGPEFDMDRRAAGAGLDPAGGGRRKDAVISGPVPAAEDTRGVPGAVKMMQNVPFPDKYRELIGDYFRRISESGTESQ